MNRTGFSAKAPGVSHTAFTAAAARAADLLVDAEPAIFSGTLPRACSAIAPWNWWRTTGSTAGTPCWPVPGPKRCTGAGSPKLACFAAIPV